MALENIDAGTVEVLNLSSGLFTAKQCASESMSASTKVYSALLIKDKFSISNSAFHELSMIADLPTSSQVKRFTSGLNSTFSLHQTPNGIIGVQQSLRERLSICLTELIAKFDDQQEQVPTTFRVKLTGDSTQNARGLTVVNILHHQGLVNG